MRCSKTEYWVECDGCSDVDKKLSPQKFSISQLEFDMDEKEFGLKVLNPRRWLYSENRYYCTNCKDDLIFE